MANEKRLIDANALIAEYDRVHIGEPGKARKLMEDAPTIDAVEVVRCHDCEVPHNKYTGCTMLNGLVTTPAFYCPFGERKDGDDNG